MLKRPLDILMTRVLIFTLFVCIASADETPDPFTSYTEAGIPHVNLVGATSATPNYAEMTMMLDNIIMCNEVAPEVVKPVNDVIAALDEVTAENDAVVLPVAEKVDQEVTDLVQKQGDGVMAQITDYDKLIATESRGYALWVDHPIASLPQTVALEDGEAMCVAHAGHEALTLEQKSMVTKPALLEATEQAWAVLKYAVGKQ